MKKTTTFVSARRPAAKTGHFMVAAICLAALCVGGCPEPKQRTTIGRQAQSNIPRTDPPQRKPFLWPEGKRAAISLTFDDARATQADVGLAVLDSHGLKATFYISPRNAVRQLKAWQKAVANGHEIGNHTLSHPCTGNFTWSRQAALEDYTLEAMAYDIDEATASIYQMLKVRPTTFAYPCGQKFVGRGSDVKSYVPLVAERFIVGRGAFDEVGNDPAFCDLAQVAGIQLDGLDFQQIKKVVDQAKEERRWLVFFGHEIGAPAYQTTGALALDELCQYATSPGSGLWVDTVEAVGRYILEQRAQNPD